MENYKNYKSQVIFYSFNTLIIYEQKSFKISLFDWIIKIFIL